MAAGKIFRLTRWMQEAALEGWFAWLEGRNIPCAIVEDLSREGNFAVWRHGAEHATGDGWPERKGRWDTNYRVVKEANGFSQALQTSGLTSKRRGVGEKA